MRQLRLITSFPTGEFGYDALSGSFRIIGSASGYAGATTKSFTWIVRAFSASEPCLFRGSSAAPIFGATSCSSAFSARDGEPLRSWQFAELTLSGCEHHWSCLKTSDQCLVHGNFSRWFSSLNVE